MYITFIYLNIYLSLPNIYLYIENYKRRATEIKHSSNHLFKSICAFKPYSCSQRERPCSSTVQPQKSILKLILFQTPCWASFWLILC